MAIGRMQGVTNRLRILRKMAADMYQDTDKRLYCKVDRKDAVQKVHDLADEALLIGNLVQKADGDVDAAISAAGAILGTTHEALIARHGITFRDELIQQFPPKSPTDKKQDFIEEPPLRVSLV